jgi:hypothetical protein
VPIFNFVLGKGAEHMSWSRSILVCMTLVALLTNGASSK